MKFTSKTVMVCMVICIVLVFTYLNVFLNSLNIQSIDLTKDKLYTLSESTKEILKDVDKEVNIVIFGFEYNYGMRDLIKKYNKQNNKITVEIANIISRPDIAEEYDLLDGDGLIIIESEDRIETLEFSDLYGGDFMILEIFDITEQKVTNAIISAAELNKEEVAIRKNTGTIIYEPTLMQHRIIMVIIFTIPAAIVIAGIIIGVRRKIKCS